jgi:hypothetical protein
LLFFCFSAFSSENCNVKLAENIFDAIPISSLPEQEKCRVNGVTVENGICILSFYKRLPNPLISMYSVDFKKGIVEFVEGTHRLKKIKLTPKQKNEIECLSYGVWVHKNGYFEERRKMEVELKARQESSLATQEAQIKEQEEKYLKECKIKKISCKFVPEVTAEDVGKLPDMLPHVENDLLTFSFHYSQHLTLISGERAKLVGGQSVEFQNEASKLYNYVATLFVK